MKEYGLIKIDTNWEDEMDIEGFMVCDPANWNALLVKIQSLFEKYQDLTVGIGTNEEIIFNDYQDFISICDIRVITEDEAALLAKHFADDPSSRDFTYAFGDLPEALVEQYQERENDDAYV